MRVANIFIVITQELVRKVSARLPIIIVLFMIVFMYIRIPECYDVIEPETKIHYRLERFGTYAKLYISHSGTFGSDYVEFNHTAICFPKFYYVAPDTLIFIDDNSFYGREVKSEQFVIEQINRLPYPELGRPNSTHEDYVKYKEVERINDSIKSLIDAKNHYTIYIHDHASGITICNPQRIRVAKKEAPFAFRGS